MHPPRDRSGRTARQGAPRGATRVGPRFGPSRPDGWGGVGRRVGAGRQVGSPDAGGPLSARPPPASPQARARDRYRPVGRGLLCGGYTSLGRVGGDPREPTRDEGFHSDPPPAPESERLPEVLLVCHRWVVEPESLTRRSHESAGRGIRFRGAGERKRRSVMIGRLTCQVDPLD